jgi:hypothetical protein
MPTLAATVHEYWLAAQREPVAALALGVSSSRCVLLQAYPAALNSHDDLSPRANLLIVFQTHLPLVPDAQLISIARQHSDPLIVVIVNQASVRFHAVGWYVSAIDLEAVDLSTDLILAAQSSASSREAYAVALAAVVALVLLVIIAVSLLPVAPALT